MQHRIDTILMLAVVSVLAASMVNLYGVSAAVGSGLLMRQVVWCVIGLSLLWACSFIRATYWEKAAPKIYALCLIALVAVLVFGQVRGGTRGWFVLGPISIQPSEFARLGTMLMVAAFLGKREDGQLHLGGFLVVSTIVAIPVGLILLEPDLGVALTYGPVLLIGWWLGGLRPRVWVVLGLLGVITAGVAWATVLKPYQKERVLTVLDADRDPYGAGYQVRQSRIAVGSGGLSGEGIGRGSQSVLRFLPAQHTDFAFASWAEATGFIGASALLVAFSVILLRLGVLTERTGQRFDLGFATIVFAWLAFQIIVNLGMVLGWLPTAGITLPLFSYGGSSVISTCATLGIVQSIWRHRFVNQ
ncbi:MAG: rod shape-determining protein RodA [Acidobacteria bacterium]|nr:MAG: rod shape-determining protein RodA [Acidobacteriota bacterium]